MLAPHKQKSQLTRFTPPKSGAYIFVFPSLSLRLTLKPYFSFPDGHLVVIAAASIIRGDFFDLHVSRRSRFSNVSRSYRKRGPQVRQSPRPSFVRPPIPKPTLLPEGVQSLHALMEVPAREPG